MSTEREASPVTLSAERSLDRRRFLLTLGAAVVAVFGGKRLAGYLEARAGELSAISHSEVKDLAPCTSRSFEQPEGEAIAVRLTDGTTVAFDRRCPHLGCPVVWAAARERFECPCHHAAFDARTGAVLFGPPKRGLTPVVLTDRPTKEIPA